MFGEPEKLGLKKSFEMVDAPKGKTFHYRNEDKRVIEPGWCNEHRLRNIKGPLIYAVTDNSGIIRYVGKWVSDTPLYQRWFRRKHIHHQTSSRNIYISELDQGKKPLTVWSASAVELKKLPLPDATLTMSNRDLVQNLEALWIQRWKPQLWNKNHEPMVSGFTDGEYWKKIP
ncbi:MAG: hypothetical protein GQ557_02305 [Mycoplasmataceae bacterium]|nr:hypothetical protein [Mycoplasmataceae bacterium]